MQPQMTIGIQANLDALNKSIKAINKIKKGIRKDTKTKLNLDFLTQRNPISGIKIILRIFPSSSAYCLKQHQYQIHRNRQKYPTNNHLCTQLEKKLLIRNVINTCSCRYEYPRDTKTKNKDFHKVNNKNKCLHIDMPFYLTLIILHHFIKKIKAKKTNKN